jgi:hypothetical protein
VSVEAQIEEGRSDQGSHRKSRPEVLPHDEKRSPDEASVFVMEPIADPSIGKARVGRRLSPTPARHVAASALRVLAAGGLAEPLRGGDGRLALFGFLAFSKEGGRAPRAAGERARSL